MKSNTKTPPPKPRGGDFFLVDPAQWRAVSATNDLHAMTVFLALQRGTASDRITTGWSSHALENYTGMGKATFQNRVGRLMDLGILERGQRGTHRHPLYVFTKPDEEVRAIALPNALIDGLKAETPALRRVRETRDPLLLRLLIDLYALVEGDLTWGVSVAHLSNKIETEFQPRLIIEAGNLSVWGIDLGRSGGLKASPELVAPHIPAGHSDELTAFLDRLEKLERLGLVRSEDWLFIGPDDHDDEPIMPLTSESYFERVEELTDKAGEAAFSLLERVAEHMIDKTENLQLIPLPLHFPEPARRKVYRLRVEPNTPSRQRAFARTMTVIEGFVEQYGEMLGALYAHQPTPAMRTHFLASPYQTDQ